MFKLNHSKILPVLLATIFLSSCGSNSGPQTLPPQELPVVEVMSMDVPEVREFVGEVYGFQDVPIRARVDGVLEDIYFEEGSEVTKGQLLYSIDSQPYEAELAARQSELREAQTILVQRESDLARTQPLAEISAVSQRELDAAIAGRDAAQATVEAARSNVDLAKIKLGYATIKSPINGIIGKTEAKIGEYVGKEPNPVILNVVSKTESIRVQFFLTESEYLFLQREVQQRIAAGQAESRKDASKLDLVFADGSVLGEPGDFDFIDRAVNPGTGSFLVQASFPNPDLIVRPGQFAIVRISLQQQGPSILVPQRCVQELQGNFRVYVVDEEGIVDVRPVEVGPTYKNLWTITSGLKSGEKVILEGIQKVRSGVKIVPDLTEFEIIPPETQPTATSATPATPAS